MNKSFYKKILVTFVFALVALVGYSSTAFAVVFSNISFDPNPLFNSVNVAPGHSVSGTVTVTNTGETAKSVLIKAVNVVNTGSFKLGDVVRLTVKEGDAVLYDKTFSEFFNTSASSEVTLSSVPAGQTAVFTFTASFDSASNDHYQNSQMGFDLQVGFDDGSETTTTTSIGQSQGSGAGSGGNGMIIGSKNLIISNEVADPAEAPSAGSVLITWDTNMPATSQVIYGATSAGPYSINLTLPNFGYQFSTAETDLDANKTMTHAVSISGLPAGQYSYRVVSRASPPTVSYEHYFAVGENGTVENREVGSQNQPSNPAGGNENVNPTGRNPLPSEGEGQGGVATDQSGQEASSTIQNQNQNTSQTAAALFGASWLNWRNGLFALAFFLLLWLLIFFYRRQKEE